MAKATKSLWAEFAALIAVLIAVLMLSACGSSTDSNSSTNPVTTTLGGTNTTSGSPVIIGFNDGSVYRFSGTYNVDMPFYFLILGQANSQRVNQMTDFVDNSNHVLMVQLGEDNFIRWNGTNLMPFPLSGVSPVTKMVPYNNGVIVGLNDGEVWQFFNSTSTWVELHDNGFGSAVSQMTVLNNDVVIALADNALFQWHGGSAGQCDKGQIECWTKLTSPANSSSVVDLITYTDNDNNQQLALGLSNGAVFINSANGWSNIGNGGSAKIVKMAAFSNDNSLGSNSFLVAYSDGRVYQWVLTYNRLIQVISTSNAEALTQMAVFKDSIITAYGNVLMQTTFQPNNVIEHHAITGMGWGSAVTQILGINDELIVSLADGTILGWDGNPNYIWEDLNIKNVTSHPVTQLVLYNDHLVVGSNIGEVLQWNGNTNPPITQLHDGGWGSAVEYIVNLNNLPVIGLANAAVEVLQNNSSWKEFEKPAPTIACNNTFYSMQQYQLVATNQGDLVVGMSQGDDSLFNRHSASVMNDLSLGLPIPNSLICVDDLSNSDNAYIDKISQMVSYKNGVYAGYADGGSVRAWDGNPAHSLTQIHDAGWVSSISAMTIFNDKLIVGLSNGAIEQWDGDGSDLSVTSWTELHDSGYGSAVLQIINVNGMMTVRLANGNIAQRLANGTWDFIGNFSSGTITQMATFKKNLVYGMPDGQIWQFDSSVHSWHQLPEIVFNSGVKQLVDNGNLIAGFANGLVAQWDGSQWTVVLNINGYTVTQMMAQ